MGYGLCARVWTSGLKVSELSFWGQALPRRHGEKLPETCNSFLAVTPPKMTFRSPRTHEY